MFAIVFYRRNTNIGLSPHDWRAHKTSPVVKQLLRQCYVSSSGKNKPYHEIWVRSGLGIWKYRFGLSTGYRVLNQSQVRAGQAPCKTLPENTCITGKVIHSRKVSNCVSCNIKFSQAMECFSILSIWWASNQSILSLRMSNHYLSTKYNIRKGQLEVVIPSQEER